MSKLSKVGAADSTSSSSSWFDINIEEAMTMDSEMESYRVFERDYRDTIESTMVEFAKGAHRVLISDALGVKKSVIVTQVSKRGL